MESRLVFPPFRAFDRRDLRHSRQRARYRAQGRRQDRRGQDRGCQKLSTNGITGTLLKKTLAPGRPPAAGHMLAFTPPARHRLDTTLARRGRGSTSWFGDRRPHRRPRLSREDGAAWVEGALLDLDRVRARLREVSRGPMFLKRALAAGAWSLDTGRGWPRAPDSASGARFLEHPRSTHLAALRGPWYPPAERRCALRSTGAGRGRRRSL